MRTELMAPSASQAFASEKQISQCLDLELLAPRSTRKQISGAEGSQNMEFAKVAITNKSRVQMLSGEPCCAKRRTGRRGSGGKLLPSQGPNRHRT